MKVVPYTAVIGERDDIRDDIKCFTEKDFNKFKTPRMNSRIVKILSHQWVDADISIWMDGCVFPRVNTEALLGLLGDADMFMSLHSEARNMEQELELLKTYRKNNISGVREQIDHYLGNGLSRDSGMWWAGFIIRRHNKVVEDFNRKWWEEICRWSERDQIALPYVFSKCPDLKLKTVPFQVVDKMMDIMWHETDK